MANIANLIDSINPTNNQTEVLLNEAIVIRFNEYMNPATLNANTILVTRGGVLVPATYTYQPLTRDLIIQPTSLLNGSTTYSVKVKGLGEGPAAKSGDVFPREYIFYYTTTAEVGAEEELPPEMIPDVTIPESDAFFSNISIWASYPESGDLVDGLEDIVVTFSTEIDTTALESKVFLQEQAISPLLRRLKERTRIPLTVDDEASNGQTIVFVPTSEVKLGVAYELILTAGIASKIEPNLTLGTDQTIPFQTKWELFYTSVDSVKLILGLFREAYTDAEIATMIHQQSLATYQLVSMLESFDPILWEGTAPYAASQYVLYRTAYQSMLGQVIESSSGMHKSIQLGDLRVSDSSSVSAEITDLMGLFQKEMDKWWDVLTGGEDITIDDGIYRPVLSSRLGTATKGETVAPYPGFLSRSSYAELGG